MGGNSVAWLTQPSHSRNIVGAARICGAKIYQMTEKETASGAFWSLKRRVSRRVLVSTILFCLAAISLHGNNLFAARKSEVSHIVFIWLKRPGDVHDQQLLIHATQSFRKIRGVVRVNAGAGLPVQRENVEQPFDVGVVIVFRDRAALENYEKNPRHLEAIREVLRPLARRYLIYNFSNG